MFACAGTPHATTQWLDRDRSATRLPCWCFAVRSAPGQLVDPFNSKIVMWLVRPLSFTHDLIQVGLAQAVEYPGSRAQPFLTT